MDAVRIGDAERESAVAALGEHYAQGRLTKEEFDERSEAAWSARTGPDLGPLFADLPRAAAPAVPPGPSGRASWPAASWPVPHRSLRARPVLVAVLAVLVVVTVLSHLPFVLLGLLVWFLLSRRYAVARPPWAGRHPHRSHGPRR